MKPGVRWRGVIRSLFVAGEGFLSRRPGWESQCSPFSEGLRASRHLEGGLSRPKGLKRRVLSRLNFPGPPFFGAWPEGLEGGFDFYHAVSGRAAAN